MSKRIPINQQPSGLNNPFAALDVASLPQGEIPPPVPSSKPEKPARHGRVLLRREKAHRGGKTVIVVHDFQSSIPGARIEELAGKLKSACACGGTVRDRTIEIQGDQPARIRGLLEDEGFRVGGIR